MPATVISTWFYAEQEGEESVYPQVGGRSSSTWFQAVYWRCVVDFFAASARVNPDVEHRLYTNVDTIPDVEGFDTGAFLARLGVEIVVLPYAMRPPAGYFGAWANQFYVLDVTAHLAETLGPDDVGLLLDSDCVFTRPVGPLADAAREHGALTFNAQIGPDEEQNGLTPREMGQIYQSLGGGSGDGADPIPAYVGGEIVAGTGTALAAIVAEARAVWPEMLRRHEAGLPKFNEEAHLLSYVYHRLDYPLGTADPFIDRMFTWFTGATVAPGHEEMMIWHLPNEKRLGLRRLFRAVADDASWFWTMPTDGPWRQRLGQTLGVPKRTPVKWVRDVGRAVRDKVERPN
ncbi:hypothetical protein [Rubrivirga sp. IMCC43871]|uniref:hypothetical protein n=1 Tax=Rubrivirga sp. IMCC43871 TaxID=3391575 RepID=UPI00398FF3BD